MIAEVLNFVDLKAVLGPLIGGFLGGMGARASIRSGERIEQIRREDAAARLRETQFSAQADDMTERFRVLMDGYEVRIRDLTDEVTSLRNAVSALLVLLAN